MIIVTCLLMGKKSLSLKPTIKMLTFQFKIFFESMSNVFSATESREVSLNRNVYDFSVDHNNVDKLKKYGKNY